MRQLLLLAALLACQRKPQALPHGTNAAGSDDPDRHELVLQPLGQWTPEDAPLRLKLQLISEKSSVMAGGGFRYRMESRNVGRDPVVFKESAPSFIKDGSLCGESGYRFFATPPQGAEQPLPCDPARKASAGSALDLTLQSGEFLLTRPEGPGSRFRELPTAFRFEKPGSYRIKAVYSAPGLRAESNEVVFEVREVKKPMRPSGRPPHQPVNSASEAGEAY